MEGKFTIVTAEKIFEDKDFEIQFSKCNYEKCLSHKLFESSDRIYYSLHLIIDGSGFLNVNGNTVQLKKDDMFIVFPGKNTIYYPDSSNPWAYIWIDVMGKNLESLFKMCGFEIERPYNSEYGKSLNALFQKLLRTHNDPNCLRLECNAILLNIIAKLILFHSKKELPQNSKSGQRTLVREAMVFISNNYRLDISLSDISYAISVSNSYLISLFAREVNISPMKYLMLYRIASACELLAKGDKNVTEVSFSVGFNDPLYFSRCFSAVKGMSPRKYMKNPTGDPWAFFKENNIDYR